MQRMFAAVVLALLLGASASAACPNPRPRLVRAEFFQSDAVVTARFMRARHVTVSDDDDYLLYTMQTERVLRGKMRAIFRVIDSPYASGRALAPEKGERYLLFLSYQKEHKAWTLDGCGNSELLQSSTEALKEIHQLQAGGHGGTVQGNVWLPFDAEVKVNGATVLVRGKQGTFKATTDQEGNFAVHVPAGVYSAKVFQKGKRFEPDIWSYEDPKRFRVSNGGSAQLQFEQQDGH